MEQDFKSVVSDTLKTNAELLHHVSQEIWKNPELKFEEKHAHDLLTKVLEEKGFTVQRGYIISTAFRAEYQSKSN